MSTIGSSVINKSSKKFAPKAVSQRREGRSAGTGRRESIERQPSTGTPFSNLAPSNHDVLDADHLSTRSVSAECIAGNHTTSQPLPADTPDQHPSESVTGAIDDGSVVSLAQADTQPPPPLQVANSQASPRQGSEKHISVNNSGERSLNASSQTAGPAQGVKRKRFQPTPVPEPEPNLNSTQPANTTVVTPLAEALSSEVASEPSEATTRRPRTRAEKRRSAAIKSSSLSNSANDIDNTHQPNDAVSDPVKKSRRKRKQRQDTPEEAESVEIAPALVKMAELCQDPRTGKKSQRERDLRALDRAEVVKRQEKRRARRESGTVDAEETAQRTSDRAETPNARAQPAIAAPQMRIVDGKIVLDDQSLQVDRHANAAAQADVMEEIVETELTRKVNAGSWLKKTQREAWDEDTMDLFYRGLRMFGTDFEIISKMLPGKTRRHVKNKFVKEERANSQRIKNSLIGEKSPIDLAAYSELTNTEFEDVALFTAQLEEEARVHSAEQEKQSIEARGLDQRKRFEDDEQVNDQASEHAPEDSSPKEIRASNVQPSAGSKRPRKGAGKKKKPLRRPDESAAEVLGSIEDVQRHRAAVEAGDE
ncbi:MAG: Transcription factor TFIIIB component B [Caeruleum heppii]|nr:MAG: Transcription factor TFIIIB component B [Caeruleum heppii]